MVSIRTWGVMKGLLTNLRGRLWIEKKGARMIMMATI